METTETYEYGAAVTLREKPSREGYTFKGWSYENGFKMPAGDVVIEGSYKINSYTVTYKGRWTAVWRAGSI